MERPFNQVPNAQRQQRQKRPDMKGPDNINDIPPAVDSDALNRAGDIWDVLRHHANAVYSLGQTSTLEAARLIYARIRKLMDKDSKFSV